MAAQVQTIAEPLNLMKTVRSRLGLSQRAFADLLGCSLRAVQSAEQGWRHTSPALEKLALLLLVSLRRGPDFAHFCCWETNNCPMPQREKCLTYRFRQGHLCWFLTSTMCNGTEARDWQQKRAMCLACPFFASILGDSRDDPSSGVVPPIPLSASGPIEPAESVA